MVRTQGYNNSMMSKTIQTTLFALLLFFDVVITGQASAQKAPMPLRVAVFYEPNFPYFGVNSQTSPPEIARRLRENGVPAETLGEEALANPAKFNAAHYAALVLPYGNAYPDKAFGTMQTFHRAGGALILSGIPFTHPIARTANGRWRDLGHRGEAALFGPKGIGVGGFTNSEQDTMPTIDAREPLGLASLLSNPGSYAHAQRLDPASLPAGDVVVPIIGAADRPALALIEHKSAPYTGAVDVWTQHGPDGDLEVWLTEQLLLRGTIAALEHKGLLMPEKRQSAYARFAQIPKPMVYAGLVLPSIPRPYATFQPKMPPPARHMLVADVRRLTFAERVLLISLQGIVNRTQPRIYLIVKDTDRFWLDEMRKKGDIDSAETVTNPLRLVKTFRSSIQGAVVADSAVYLSPCVAASISGLDDLVIATPALAAQLDLPIKTDLRGKFKTDIDALHFIHTALQPRLNPYLACSLDPTIFDSGALDQIIAAKGLVFWITGTKAQELPGARGPQEITEVKAILAAMPLTAVVRGFWWHGEDMGINEGPGVSLGSRFGKVTVVSDYVANFSVISGIPAPTLKQKPQAPPPQLDPTKVYYCFTMSDGDNLCTWRDYFRTYFEDPLHGTIPIGWGMGPTLIDNAPVWARWYYDHATPNDEFLCDVSGIGYIYGPDWATALKDREGAFANFYQWTEQYMQRLDMHTIRLMNVEAPNIAQAARLMPNVRFLVPDYGNGGGKSYAQMTYDLPNDQTVFRAITGADPGPEKLAEQIKTRIGAQRPAFTNVFIWNWGSKLKDLKRLQELLGPEYVAVTPSQLYALYKQAHPATTP